MTLQERAYRNDFPWHQRAKHAVRREVKASWYNTKRAFFIGLIFAVLLFWSKIFRWFQSLSIGTDDTEVLTAADEITTQIRKSFTPNWSILPQKQVYYEQLVGVLIKAMDGWGTNWNIIDATIQPLSIQELEAVYWCFGGRVNHDFFNEAYDLTAWLQVEFSGISPLCVYYWGAIAAKYNKTRKEVRKLKLSWL